MKKYLLGLLAIIFAIAFNAFSKPDHADKKSIAYYLVYGGGYEKDTTSYTQTFDRLPTCPGASNKLCWIVVDDANFDGVINQTELDDFFCNYDSDVDGLLSDQIEIAGRLEKRF